MYYYHNYYLGLIDPEGMQLSAILSYEPRKFKSDSG